MSAAGTRYRVTAREAEGFLDYRRAGEAWPRGAGNYREVLVLDQDADPPGRQVDGQFAIGRNTFAIIEADKHLFVTGSRDSAADDAEMDELRARVAELEAGNTSLKDRCVELEQLLATATAPAAPEGTNDGAKPAGKPAKK